MLLPSDLLDLHVKDFSNDPVFAKTDESTDSGNSSPSPDIFSPVDFTWPLEDLDCFDIDIPLVPHENISISEPISIQKQASNNFVPTEWNFEQNSSVLGSSINQLSTDFPITHPKPQRLTKYSSPELRLQKKQEKIIRNRQSAARSRQRGKEYVNSLEVCVKQQSEQIESLQKQNAVLENRVKELESQLAIRHVAPHNSHRQSSSIGKRVGTTFACVFLIFNFHYLFSNTFAPPVNSSPTFVSRKLMNADPNFNSFTALSGDFNSSTKTASSQCGHYLNQTRRDRIVQDLKGALKGNREFHKSSSKKRHNISSFSRLTNNVDAMFNEIMKTMDVTRRRDDDKLYMIALGSNEFLFPQHNTSSWYRPKISLVMPAVNNTINSSTFKVGVNSAWYLMQIDCEIMDTHLLSKNATDYKN